MLGQIIRKEILEHLMSLRFGIACVLCLCVILSSLFVRSRDHSQLLADYQNNTRLSYEELQTVRHPNEWNRGRMNLEIYFPPNPLKVFVQGAEETNGEKAKLSYRELPRFSAEDLVNASAPLFLTVDFVTFVGIIMSLMAIVFGYDSICGEKERGTLRLMLSYSVPRDRVLLGKWIGGYFTLIIPFTLTVISGLAIILVQGTIVLDQQQWLKLLSVLLISYFYIAAIYSLALWVSSIVPKASTSIMLLITIWVVFILAVPNLSPYAAALFKPIELDKQNLTARTELVQEVWSREYVQPRREWLRSDGKKRSREERSLYESELRQQARLETLRALEKIEQKNNADLSAQVVLSQWFSRFSPYACFAMAVSEVTDSGLGIRDSKSEQAINYQKRFINYVDQEFRYATQYQIDNGKLMKRWRGKRQAPIPRFQYRTENGFEALKQVTVDVGIIIAIIILFFMLSFMSFLKYDVR